MTLPPTRSQPRLAARPGRTTRQRTSALLWPLALVAVLGLAACTGGEDDATDDVATLGADGSSGDESSDDEDDEDDEGGGGRGGRQVDPEFQDAMVEFAECMREQGIDFPDPQVDGDGGVIISGPSSSSSAGEPAGPPSDAQMEEMEAAHQACEHILEAVEGSMPELDPAEEQEMRDQALEFAECMREQGIDFPDPVFSDDAGGGRVEVHLDESGGGGGIDPNDEDFQAAAEECGGEGGFIGVPGASASGGDG